MSVDITEKVKEFVKRCYEEKGYNKQSLIQDISNKLHHHMHSPLEAEILPHVVSYLQKQEV